MAEHDMDSAELESAYLEAKYAGHRETVVSGEWLLASDGNADAPRYRVGYAALVADAEKWNGFPVPLVTREVADRFCAEQAQVNADFPDDSETWTFDGDVLVVKSADFPAEYEQRIEATDGLYRLDLGYTFAEVDAAECDEVVAGTDGTHRDFAQANRDATLGSNE